MARLGDTLRRLSQLTPQQMPQSRERLPVLKTLEGFGENPGALRMKLHAPEGLPPHAPLVVVLHGCTQSADGYASGAGWIAAANRFGFALLCPEQVTGNNPNLCFNWFVAGDTRRNSGEAASIAAMIAHTVSLQRIDPQRIFITGLSAGGAMANVMLATYPEIFSGGAIIAGLPYGSANTVAEAFAAMSHQRRDDDEMLGGRVRSAAARHEGPWPKVSVWHGEADATVAPAAGDAIVRQWANVHGVSTPASSKDGAATRRTWRSETGAVVVEHITIRGMGHGTPLHTSGPDGLGSRGPYLLDVGMSSTLTIAKTWGIADTPISTVTPSPAISTPRMVMPEVLAAPSPALAPFLRKQMPRRTPAGIDVAEVINSALRAAGLVK